MTLRVAHAQGWKQAGLVEGEEGVVGGFDKRYVQDHELEEVRLCSGSGFIVEPAAVVMYFFYGDDKLVVGDITTVKVFGDDVTQNSGGLSTEP